MYISTDTHMTRASLARHTDIGRDQTSKHTHIGPEQTSLLTSHVVCSARGPLPGMPPIADLVHLLQTDLVSSTSVSIFFRVFILQPFTLLTS